eukprot:COSAG01_NODE_389_length_17708_cov_111.404452_9_plen_116_part_00
MREGTPPEIDYGKIREFVGWADVVMAVPHRYLVKRDVKHWSVRVRRAIAAPLTEMPLCCAVLCDGLFCVLRTLPRRACEGPIRIGCVCCWKIQPAVKSSSNSRKAGLGPAFLSVI